MGRKQRAKQERRESTAPLLRAGRRSTASAWIAGTLVGIGLVVAAIVIIVQTQKETFLRLALTSAAAGTLERLEVSQMRFPLEDRRQLEAIVKAVQALAARPALDSRAAGQLRFVLNVIDEITAAGSLEPGELDKLRMQVSAAGQYLLRRPSGQATPAP